MVPVTGLEPVRHRWRRILSPLRLPFHHTGRCLTSILYFPVNCKQKLWIAPKVGCPFFLFHHISILIEAAAFSVINHRQQFQLQHIFQQCLAQIFFRHERFFPVIALHIVFAGLCIRPFCPRPMLRAMPAINPEDLSLIKGVMLPVIINNICCR